MYDVRTWYELWRRTSTWHTSANRHCSTRRMAETISHSNGKSESHVIIRGREVIVWAATIRDRFRRISVHARKDFHKRIETDAVSWSTESQLQMRNLLVFGEKIWCRLMASMTCGLLTHRFLIFSLIWFKFTFILAANVSRVVRAAVNSRGALIRCLVFASTTNTYLPFEIWNSVRRA